MANLVAIQELENGPRNLRLKVDIEGDGSSEFTNELLVEVGAFNCTEVRLDSIQGNLDGFYIRLEWDGTTKAPLFVIPNALHSYIDLDWAHGHKTVGLINPKVANYTGDVVMTSIGLESGETASLVFHFIKKQYEVTR